MAIAPATMPMRTPPPETLVATLEPAVPEGVTAVLRAEAIELRAAVADPLAPLSAALTEADADEAEAAAADEPAEALEAEAAEAEDAAAEAEDKTAVLVLYTNKKLAPENATDTEALLTTESQS